MSASDPAPLRTLPRVLGLFDSVMIVIGSIIGSGVFLKASTVSKALPGTGAILGVWVGVGIVTLCGSLAIAELAAMLPQAGGPYVYLREAYGRLPAFLWGWTEFWIVRTASLGALSAATVMYLNELVFNITGRSLNHVDQAIAAMLVVVVISYLNILSTRWGASIQNLTVIIKVGFLAALIVLPILLGKAHVQNLQPIGVGPSEHGLLRGIGLAVIAVMFPYDGWVNISPVAEEIREPQRNIPRSIAIGVFIVIVVYVSANAVYHLVLPLSEVQKTERIAARVWEIMFGPVGAGIAAAGVMCSTFGAVNANILTGPRVYFAMARDGLLPETLRRIHSVYLTPYVAVGLQAAWSVLLILAAYAWKADPRDAFDALTDFAIFGGLAFYAMAVAAVFVLRKTRPELPRPYRTWGYPFTPAIYLLTFCGVVVSMFVEKWLIAITGSSLIAAGIVYYIWRGHAASRSDD